MELNRFARFMFQPVLPLGKNGKLVTGSEAHWAVAKKACSEGTVLLKNNGALPLKKEEKVCLFGLGAGAFQFGGGGSGKVYAEKLVTLGDGLKNAAEEGKIRYFEPLTRYYEETVNEIYRKAKEEYPDERKYAAWERSYRLSLPQLPATLYKEAVAFGGTAIFCHSRFSSEGDLGGDRSPKKGDFYLSDEEEALLSDLCRDFEKVVVVLNTCGPVSTLEFKKNEKIGAVLYPLFGGGISGESLTEILLGEDYPSGHLQHTLAEKIEDYPGTLDFHKSPEFVDYTEDIFVGYRYFETFCPEKVVYPFGFGLSYTEFEKKLLSAQRKGMKISLTLSVKNKGEFKGKEVVQAYLSAPQGKLGKAAKVLCAFGKTKELLPGEEETLRLTFSLRDFASFDDLGKIRKSSFVLEKGEYTIFAGSSVKDCAPALRFDLKKNTVVKTVGDYMAPRKLKERLTSSGKTEKLPAAKKVFHESVVLPLSAEKPEQPFFLENALRDDRLEEFLASLSDKELGEMLYGHEMMNPSSTNAIGLSAVYYLDDKKLIPAVPTSDGPMGLRMRKGRGVAATHFPCSNTVSQTWNLSLARKVGKTIALEAKENNVGIWLAPGLNIHRNPLCGRNFEYFSEDPLTSGEFAASYVKGVQGENIAATVKHFCCNNREYYRRVADSRVSQRALREIYLRGFEIVVKKAEPWCLMTSYNLINGEQASTNHESINGILRGEWGFGGVVMTDWRTYSLLEDEIKAGSDVKMPQRVSTVYPKAPKDIDPEEMIRKGIIPRDCAITSVRRILKMMSHLE